MRQLRVLSFVEYFHASATQTEFLWPLLCEGEGKSIKDILNTRKFHKFTISVSLLTCVQLKVRLGVALSTNMSGCLFGLAPPLQSGLCRLLQLCLHRPPCSSGASCPVCFHQHHVCQQAYLRRCDPRGFLCNESKMRPNGQPAELGHNLCLKYRFCPLS